MKLDVTEFLLFIILSSIAFLTVFLCFFLCYYLISPPIFEGYALKYDNQDKVYVIKSVYRFSYDQTVYITRDRKEALITYVLLQKLVKDKIDSKMLFGNKKEMRFKQFMKTPVLKLLMLIKQDYKDNNLRKLKIIEDIVKKLEEG